jgi:hypothetical protein
MGERDLKGKSASLREAMPKEKAREAPQEDGKRLGVIRRGDEELRIVWSAYEGRPYLSLRIWTKGSNGVFYPEKARGFTVRLRELPDFAEAIGSAVEEADEYYATWRKQKEEEERRTQPAFRVPPASPNLLRPVPEKAPEPLGEAPKTDGEDDSHLF